MDIADIDFIAAPVEPGAGAEFDLLRSLVRRHVLSGQGKWLGHRELTNVVERRRAAAAAEELRLSKPTTTLVPAEEGRHEYALLTARQKWEAYAKLQAALEYFCGVTCSPPL